MTATAKPARKFACTAPTPSPLQLPCPSCGEPTVSVHFERIDGADAFTCSSCDGEWSFDHLRLVVNVWARALDWLSTLPVTDDVGDDGLPVEE